MGKSSDILAELIDRRLAPGADIAAIDRKIRAMFEETWAILCLDMAGFSRRTRDFGIIHFLTLIHEMRRILRPVILAHNGILFKQPADNLFVSFRDPADAVRCAVEVHRTTAAYNVGHDPNLRIAVSIGIGYGEVLRLGDEDCFGAEVNYAFKLGEDIAGPNETLLTENAYAAVRDRFAAAPVADAAGLVANYYRLASTPLERDTPDAD